MNEKWNKYVRARTATNIIVHRKETEGSEEGKVVAGSAEPSHGQRAEDLTGSARENAQRQECRQRRRKTCLQVFYYWRVFRGDEVVNCAVLIEMSVMAWKVTNYRALNSKLEELEKQERRDREELAKRSQKLANKMGAASKTNTSLEEALRGN